MKDSNDIKETDAIGNHMRTLLKDYIPFGRLKCLSYNEAMAELKKKYAEESKELPFHTATFFLRNAWRPVNNLLQEFSHKHRNKIARTILKTDDTLVIKELAIEISKDIVSLYSTARKHIQAINKNVGFDEETTDELEKIDSELNLCDIRLCCIVQTILYNKFITISKLINNKNN